MSPKGPINQRDFSHAMLPVSRAVAAFDRRISRRTLLRLLSLGALRGRRQGTHWMVDVVELRRYLTEPDFNRKRTEAYRRALAFQRRVRSRGVSHVD